MFEKIRATTWIGLFVALLTYATAVTYASFSYDGPIGRGLLRLQEATRGWVSLQLVLPLATLWAVSYGVFVVGGLRGIDIGWRVGALLPAAALTLLFWLAAEATRQFLPSGGAGPSEPWREGQAPLAILTSQLLGNALLEETFFRGYLLPQLHHKVSRLAGRGLALTAAILLSVGLFTLSHVPRLVHDFDPGELSGRLFWVFQFGLVLTLVFLLTRNLFLCVGLHALWNVQVLFRGREGEDPVWWTWTILLLIAWSAGKGFCRKERADLRTELGRTGVGREAWFERSAPLAGRGADVG